MKKKKHADSSNSRSRVLGNTKPPLPPVREYMMNLEKGGTLTVESPFVVEILKEILPLNVKQPHLESYEGLTDPDDHLACFLYTL